MTLKILLTFYTKYLYEVLSSILSIDNNKNQLTLINYDIDTSEKCQR